MIETRITSIVAVRPDGTEHDVPVLWSVYLRPPVATINGVDYVCIGTATDGRPLYREVPPPPQTDDPYPEPTPATLVDLYRAADFLFTVWAPAFLPELLEAHGLPFRRDGYEDDRPVYRQVTV